MGTDSREGLDPTDPDAGGFLGDQGCDCTDTIMVVRLDPKQGTASILSFPRDLYVPIAGTGQLGPHQHRPRPGRADADRHDPAELRRSRSTTTSRSTSSASSRSSTPSAACRCGSTLPCATRTRACPSPAPQCVVLDGEQARKFVRSRHLEYQGTDGRWHGDPTADLGRITRQQIFIRRAIHVAVGKGLTNPMTLNDLVSAGVANVKLDEGLSAGDLLALGRAFAKFDSDRPRRLQHPVHAAHHVGGATAASWPTCARPSPT